MNKEQERLIRKLEEACAWGVPDRESTGYSSSEFASLCGRAARELRSILSEKTQMKQARSIFGEL